MSEIQKKTHKTRSKATWLFGCFGFSGDALDQMSPEKVGSGSRKKSRLSSWSKFRMKRPPAKTVPVDASGVSDKPTQYSIEARASKAKSVKRTTSKRPPRHQIPARKSDKDIINKPQQMKDGADKITVLENRSRRHFDSAKDNTGQERYSHPGSPESKFNSGPISAIMTSNSASIPARRSRDKRKENASSHPSEASSKNIGNFDKVVGMSVIMVTLIIMILWGRLCAILCTSACFYFIPLLKKSIVETSNDAVKNHSNSSKDLMDSSEYKKKVVLEGFLERNHRR